MTDWRPKMGPAKFRGVSFHVENVERSGGRRGVTHKYPGRDESFREDLGRETRSFPVEGYVIGDDYLAKRDSLLAALEQAGPGELVHPHYGTLRVAAVSYRVRERPTSEGGIARFSIEFEATSATSAQPTTVIDAASTVEDSTTAARASVLAEFLAKYSPGTLMASVSGAIRSATLKINNAISTVAMESAQISQLRTRIDAFEGSVVSLINQPSVLFEAVSQIIDLIGDTAALLKIYGFDPGVTPPSTTSNRQQELQNFEAARRMVQRLALLRAVELLPSQTFDSYDAAVAARDSVANLLDDQAETTTDDTFPALIQLRGDLVNAVPGDDSKLARLLAYTPPANVPSLVLAHRLYGNVSLESDLIARNKIENPFFIRGGVALEVLSSE